MHGADQHVDFVALDELVSVLWRFGWFRFVVDGEVFQLAAAEFAAALVDGELKSVGDGGAELSIGAGVGQHQADADPLRLGDGEGSR